MNVRRLVLFVPLVVVVGLGAFLYQRLDDDPYARVPLYRSTPI